MSTPNAQKTAAVPNPDATTRTTPRRWSARFIIGSLIVGATLLIAIFAPWLAPYDPITTDLTQMLKGPDLFSAHPFGTDELGRDIFSRVLHGATPVITVAGLATVFALVLGTTLGILSGFLGNWFDQILGRLADIQLSIPGLILALLALSLYGSSLTNLIIVLAIEAWPFYYRVTRSYTENARSQAYVEAAWLASVGFWSRVRNHILPGLAPTLVVSSTISFSWIVLTAAGLSFLGLGVQPSSPDWGLMIAMGQSQLSTSWWLSIVPALALVTFVVGIQLLGDALSDRYRISTQGGLS